MMNYKSASDTLRNSGYVLTNIYHMDGTTYHDFNSRKRDAAISLIVDDTTGSVKWAEVTTRKYEYGRYVPVTKKLYALQDLIDLFKK